MGMVKIRSITQPSRVSLRLTEHLVGIQGLEHKVRKIKPRQVYFISIVLKCVRCYMHTFALNCKNEQVVI